MVLCLCRSLYSLKKAPRAWFERFSSIVTAAGFTASDHEPALFIRTSTRGRTLLLLYVDDMLITSDNPQHITFVKERLDTQFLMKDLGPNRYFLGIEFSSTPEGFFLSQDKYIRDLLDRASLSDKRTINTPMELNVHLRPTDGEPLEDPTRYRHLVGSLVYLGVTHPDISYTVHILSQFVLLPLISIIVISFVSFDIYVDPFLAIFSSLALVLSSFKHILMRHGLVSTLIVDLFLPIVYFLVVLSFPCRQRSSQQFPVRVLRRSYEQWHY
ncbi:unnamed protein product [Rhodiola kirilowii]